MSGLDTIAVTTGGVMTAALKIASKLDQVYYAQRNKLCAFHESKHFIRIPHLILLSLQSILGKPRPLPTRRSQTSTTTA